MLLPLLLAAATPVAAPTPNEIVASAPATEWQRIAPEDLMVIDLAADPAGKPRRVVIQLMPAPFSQGWTQNIRKLVAARWYDGVSINRVQDNYVVQWGDANGEDKAKAKPLPSGLVAVPQTKYSSTTESMMIVEDQASGIVERPEIKIRGVDPYASTEFTLGWPVGHRAQERAVWPVHCYAMVGVGRDMPPDTGTGAELYTVIGHAPRHLDRNIALVGRVIEGIEHLSSLPRGTAPLGFYATPGERTGITSVRMGNEVAGLPGYEYLSTEAASFARYADARANRRDAFFVTPAGGADICNIPVPVRRVAR